LSQQTPLHSFEDDCQSRRQLGSCTRDGPRYHSMVLITIVGIEPEPTASIMFWVFHTQVRLRRIGSTVPHIVDIRNKVVPKAISQPIHLLVLVAYTTAARPYMITKALSICGVNENRLNPAWWMPNAKQSAIEALTPACVANVARNSWLVKNTNANTDPERNAPAITLLFNCILRVTHRAYREATMVTVKKNSKGLAVTVAQNSVAFTVFRTMHCQYDSNEVFPINTKTRIW